MTYLAYKSTNMLILHLLELCVSEVDFRDHIFVSFDLDEISNVVRVLSKAEYRCVDEFRYCAGKGECETGDASPDGTEPCSQCRVKELCCNKLEEWHSGCQRPYRIRTQSRGMSELS